MKKLDFAFQSNLGITDFTIPAGREWLPLMNGWTLVQIRQGTGYWLHAGLNRELEAGMVIMVAGCFQGGVRASQLGELSLCSFNVIPERLTALMTLGEQQMVKTPSESGTLFKLLLPTDPLAIQANELLADKTQFGFLFRLKLLQLFAESFLTASVTSEPPSSNAETAAAAKRLKVFLEQIPAAELLEMDFNDLAKATHCTSRHLSRIFYQLAGMSFTSKRSELRLEKAKDLLATSNSKVVQVALESGYNSLSQFNLMFARRYGMSPGKWRRKNGFGTIKKAGQRFNPTENKPPAFKKRLTLKFAGGRSSNVTTG